MVESEILDVGKQNANLTKGAAAVNQAPLEQEVSDEELIRAYIGKNNEVIYPKLLKTNQKLNFSFNIYAAFFGWPYFFYRKIYYPIFFPIIFIFLPKQLSQYSVYFMGAFNICFYRLYKSKIDKKIKDIKSNSLSKTREELIALASTDGGVLPVWKLTLAIVLFILVFIFLYRYANTL